MGIATQFDRYKRFVSLIYPASFNIESVIEELTQLWGALDQRSEVIRFEHTRYYEAEMGPSLVRIFLSFSSPISPIELYQSKLTSNELEKKWMKSGLRQVNIDPGGLTAYHGVLLSTKKFYHRIPVYEGIYAELSWVFEKSGTMKALAWTYPDYMGLESQVFFKNVRNKIQIPKGVPQ